MGKRLAGKTAIINGATSGIGLATAERFAEEGAQVVFSGRREEKGREIEERLKGLGYDVMFVRADCTVDADLENLVAKAIEKYKKIDILYNNAGVLGKTAFEDLDMGKGYDKVFNTNVRSYFVASQLVLRHMLEAGRGVIINTASIGGISGGEELVPYCTSKGAVILFTRSLAKEFAGRGIRVNSVSPGAIYTEMIQRDSEEARMYAHTPMKRAGEAREIANAVLFLASDEASYCNGTNLVVDGGQSA